MLVLAVAVILVLRHLRWIGDGVRDRLAAMPEARARAQVTAHLSPWAAWSTPVLMVLAAPGLLWALVTPSPVAAAVRGATVLLLVIDIPLARRSRVRVKEAAIDLRLSPTHEVVPGPTRSRRIRRWGSVAVAALLVLEVARGLPDRWDDTTFGHVLVAAGLGSMVVLLVALVAVGFAVAGRADDDRSARLEPMR